MRSGDKSIILNQVANLIEDKRYESKKSKHKVNNVTAIIGPNFHNRRGPYKMNIRGKSHLRILFDI